MRQYAQECTIVNLWVIVKCKILLLLCLGIYIYLRALRTLLTCHLPGQSNHISSFSFCIPLYIISILDKIQLDTITDVMVVLHNRNLCLRQIKSNPRENVAVGTFLYSVIQWLRLMGPACITCEMFYEARSVSGEHYFYSDFIGRNSLTH